MSSTLLPFQRFLSLGIQPPITGLKPGVNEMLNCRTFEAKPVLVFVLISDPRESALIRG